LSFSELNSVEAITLKELNQAVSIAIDSNFSEGIWFIAEINSIQERGHCYLELIEKDPNSDTIVAKANANIWRGVYVGLKMNFFKITSLQLSPGMKVLIKGRPQFHSQYGYSINITDIDPSFTLGDAAMKRAAVVRRLKEEGVYYLNAELQIPLFIKRIAVISSKGAAGYGDFMNQLTNNSGGYKYKVELFEAIMQGDSAEDSIIEALDLIASRSSEFDIVAIIRGGGALSDLSCYDRYGVASSVAQFPLPVLTGIGHDRDVSVVDEVACQMLKTPTAVAAFILDSTASLDMELSALAQGFKDVVRQYIVVNQSKLDLLANSILTDCKILLERHRSMLSIISTEMSSNVRTYFERELNILNLAKQTIELSSPENVLKKGYSMAEAAGKVITSASCLKKGDTLTTLFADGKVESIVK